MGRERLTGVVLTGGGARGAYQAGVLRAVAEIASDCGVAQPFPILTGVSAGAINASYLATHAHDMLRATRRLCEIWENLSTDQVLRVDPWSMVRVGLNGLFQLVSGGMLSEKKTRALLDTSPLRELVSSGMSEPILRRHISNGTLHGFAITAVNYSNGYSNTFFQSHNEKLQPWERIRRTSERTTILPEHIMASTAIPVLFPPAEIDGIFYGDGSLRNHTPLSPAIRLGAEQLLVIGVRREQETEAPEPANPSPGRIFSVLLNSILLDSLDWDLERVTRINETLGYLRPWAGTELRKVEPLVIRPTEDVGDIAFQEAEAMPRVLRYLLKGLGTPQENEGIISYLLFEPAFTRRLVRLGYRDTMARGEEVQAFYQ